MSNQDFVHIILFLTNLASTGGPHEISRIADSGLDSTGLRRPEANISLPRKEKGNNACYNDKTLKSEET